MSHAVSRRPLTALARVPARIRPSGIRGGERDSGAILFPRSSVFPRQYDSTVALNTHESSGDDQ
jgi:hypothetical protein